MIDLTNSGTFSVITPDSKEPPQVLWSCYEERGAPVLDIAGNEVVVDLPSWFDEHQGQTFAVYGLLGERIEAQLYGRNLENDVWLISLEVNERQELRYVGLGNKRALQKLELKP